MLRVLFVIVAWLLAGCTGGSSTVPVANVRGAALCAAATTVNLTTADLVNATCLRQALNNGTVLIFSGSSLNVTDVARALAIRTSFVTPLVQTSSSQKTIPLPSGTPGPHNPTPAPATAPTGQLAQAGAGLAETLLAVRTGANGLRIFHGYGVTKDSPGFALWLNRELTLSAARKPSTVGSSSWFQILDTTLAVTSTDYANYAAVDVSIYRLPSFNPASDFYMQQTQYTTVPNYNWLVTSGMTEVSWTYFGQFGFWTSNRIMQMFEYADQGASGSLTDFGPLNQNGSTTSNLTIGASVGANAQGPTGSINANWSQTWTQPDVTTTVSQVASAGLVSWFETMLPWNCPIIGFGTCTPPIQDAIGTYVSYQAAIYTVPAGSTQSFVVNSAQKFVDDAYAVLVEGAGDAQVVDSPSLVLTSNVVPPTFKIDQPSINVPQGGSAVLNITSAAETTTLGTPGFTCALTPLQWQIIGPTPAWLSVPVTGNGSGPITLSANLGFSAPQSVTLFFDTLPQALSPATRFGPLPVKVIMVAPGSATPAPAPSANPCV